MGTKQRICLNCDEPFLSEHPGNRICNPCKGKTKKKFDKKRTAYKAFSARRNYTKGQNHV